MELKAFLVAVSFNRSRNLSDWWMCEWIGYLSDLTLRYKILIIKSLSIFSQNEILTELYNVRQIGREVQKISV